MLFRQIFDPKLAQYAYLIGCQQTKEALVIDPMRDIDQYIALAEAEGLNVIAVAETHIHADFLSGAREFAERLGIRVYVSDEGDADWKYEWVSNYDHVLLKDGDTFRIGNIEIKAIHTPGHTPEHMIYQVTDRGGGAVEPMGIVSGDFVFVGDLGRPDLLESAAKFSGMMEPSARRLYGSVQQFLRLEDYLQVWPGHGAGSACGKALGAVPETTVGYERRFNPAIGSAAGGEDAFVHYILEGQPEPPMYFARMKRENKLGPKLLERLPSPTRLTTAELAHVIDAGQLLIVDTRVDRSAWAAKHVPGSFYTPLNKTFNQFVGSLLEDETAAICLIINDEDVDTAVRDLVRIGYDNIVSYAEPETLDHYFEDGGHSAIIDEITFEQAEQMREADGVEVLDARYSSEYSSSHVPGALNASYTRIVEYEPSIPRERTYLIHCGTGIRAAAAASYLERSGRSVKLINDSFENYVKSRRNVASPI